MFKHFRKRVRCFMDERITVCRDYLASAENRLILGLLAVGIGAGLIASAYIKI